mgnify:CR=1 FL=1
MPKPAPSPDTLVITRPDDWHLHVRDGAALAAVVPHSAAQFGRAIIMPNLVPPVTTTAQALAVAAEATVKDGPNDEGEMFDRPGRLADKFPSPFPNEQAARASNGGAYPPDLSLIAKARSYPRGFPQFIFDLFTQYQEQGPDYLHALLTGYKDNPPADFTLPEGSFYNTYFPGHAIKMPKPISDDQVTYDDGSPQTVEQYSRDVTAFLMWAAEPHMEARKRLGIQVMIFLIVLAGLLYFTKRKVWANAH